MQTLELFNLYPGMHYMQTSFVPLIAHSKQLLDQQSSYQEHTCYPEGIMINEKPYKQTEQFQESQHQSQFKTQFDHIQILKKPQLEGKLENCK
ncbi:hypothetical protein TTHERM_001178679 (macronuclear) [Tetrahymena thermophila SB210]|uniref:Uncharacterized protein n=1 Tax=Tetrahymena thermophila (strain SB210) TaxID=312017 RepID=W7X835_TETTS|nr:hypothetical protein TTHERM_001178679 [Tetrahymena thermophila SB210]EWS72588.1 hypothetical protein TTHERM_001178679 [Tetrahymena thermophila SB210]|eukprot:XP_012654871.1 hypothetical protein TTHERM_001178679 [Tetrahymena thermophila SB210]